MKLYHATSKEAAEAILKAGMRAGSYWASMWDLVDYYAETIDCEDKEPVILSVELEALDSQHLVPDHPGIAEPISTVIGRREEEVWDAWEKSDGSWRDCLELIHSVRYEQPIPPELLARQIPWSYISGIGFIEPQPL